ncbi:MAG: small basic protein [Planctomycetota bacterium]|jgi:small basic protein (TIGR04137 family)
MTMDRTLKVHGGLIGKRSVLTRAERIERLIEEDKFDPEADCPLGLPKVRVRVSKAGTKTKKAEEPKPAEGAEAAEGAEPSEAAEGAAETPSGKKAE